MQITVEQLSKIAGKPVNANMRSVIIGLDMLGHRVGLDMPHRLGQYIPQLAHESGAFRFDREVWGPTPAQKKYDTRVDLGNTPERDGDGEKNAGRGPIQVTGGYNIRKLYEWCIKMFGSDVPNFVANPDLINTDPWEGISAIWYWTEGNPEGKSLNRYADNNDPEMITRRINGGLNGYTDRLKYVTRTGLVLLGREPDDVKGFQAWAQKQGYLPADTKDAKQVDGIDGPKTRAAIHKALVALGGQQIAEADVDVKSAPVTEETVVVPKGADSPMITRIFGGMSLAGLGSFFTGIPDPLKYAVAAAVVIAVVVLIWRPEQIAARARKAIKAFGG